MKLRRVLFVSVAVALMVTIYFAGRNRLLKIVFEYEQKHLSVVYGLQVTAKAIRFTGFSDVRISELTLVPAGLDTLATAANIEFHISLTKLLSGSVGINKLHANDVAITAYHDGERSNLTFLKQGKNKETATANDSYKDRATRLQHELLRLLNTAFDARRVSFIYSDSSGINTVYIPEAHYDLQKLSASIINHNLNDTLTLKGLVLQRNSDYQFEVHHTGTDTAWLPFLNQPRMLKCGFQSISGALKFENSGDAWMINIRLHAQRLRLNYWRLAKDDVVLPETQLSSRFKITDDAIELDSLSTLLLGGASFKLSAYYQRQPDTLITFSVRMPEVPSDTFFNALPEGMFNTLKGISCSGTLAYELRFSMHTRQPDSLIFLSSLTRKEFHIIHYGKDNLTRINEPFMYDAYQGTHLMRRIDVGPQNPSFTALNRISYFLPLCIMQSEDPGFMEHRGFIPEATRESIAQDYRERRFARGGSTISMQLVKNVFLMHDKTISRKVEEALIVYLVENLQLVSKERMMEVYLNVIEWGPDIYGIGEASDFYFHKNPAQLTLPECVFLAAIIPNPRSFRYQFDKTGHAKPYITDFYKLITGRLVNRSLIKEKDTVGISPAIKLYGPASLLVRPGDSLSRPEDTLEPDLE